MFFVSCEVFHIFNEFWTKWKVITIEKRENLVFVIIFLQAAGSKHWRDFWRKNDKKTIFQIYNKRKIFLQNREIREYLFIKRIAVEKRASKEISAEILEILVVNKIFYR